MQVQVNGNPVELPDLVTVAEMLAVLGVTTRHVAVELNRELLPRGEHASQQLADGDALEIVTLVGGG